MTTIYQEATHAWFDIMSARPDVVAVAGRGRKYYAGSLRRSGKVVDDEERAFQETAGAYVGHRASTYWTALYLLARHGEVLNAPPPAGATQALVLLKKVPKEYNAAMASREMGYQMTGAWGSGEQDPLKKPISADLKGFCDRTLLQSMIPDQFASAKALKERYDALARKYPQLR